MEGKRYTVSKSSTQFFRIKGCSGAGCPHSPYQTFLNEASTQKILYHFVGNLSESPSQFEFFEFFLISQFAVRFLRNGQFIGHF